MFIMMLNRKFSFVVNGGVPGWRRKSILSQNTDEIGQVTLSMEFSDISSGTPAAKSSQVWVITAVEDSEFVRIKTVLDDKFLSVSPSDTDKHNLQVSDPDNSDDQKWIMTINTYNEYQFENVAYPNKFLAKIAASQVDQEIAMLSPLPDDSQDESNYILFDWELIPTEDLIYSSEQYSPTQFTPIFKFNGTKPGYDTDYELSYQRFVYTPNENNNLTINFTLPIQYRKLGEIDFILSMKLFGTYNNDSAQWTAIDIYVNDKPYQIGFMITSNEPQKIDFTIPFTELKIYENNTIEVKESESSGGALWLYNVAFTIENPVSKQSLGHYYTDQLIIENISGFIYDNAILDDTLRPNDPYLSFEDNTVFHIKFFVSERFIKLDNGYITIVLNHRSDEESLITITLNGNDYLSDFSINTENQGFTQYYFSLPFTSLNLEGENIFEIKLSESNSGHYNLSDIQIITSTKMPKIDMVNYENHVKNWILFSRKNIDELQKIPRDDMSALDFMINAPAWFYLPFLPASPTEISVLIKNFPLNFYIVALEIKEINKRARDFRRDLLSTDLPRKNALRHAYWMAMITRKFNAKFAWDLGNAHEYAHVDLTIEGPFDHVTDKINNAIGVFLADKNPSTDCQKIIEEAWDAGNLAWAKNFRIEADKQIADIYWQKPLDYLAEKFNAIPDFSELELNTLKKFDITVADVGGNGHDEL